MVDVDFLALEYDTGEPVAIVEYKHERAEQQFASHSSYQAMIKLGNRAALPVFAVRYAHDWSWWRVIALNDLAKDNLGERRLEMTEEKWVSLLYRLRGRDMPLSLFQDMEIEI